VGSERSEQEETSAASGGNPPPPPPFQGGEVDGRYGPVLPYGRIRYFSPVRLALYACAVSRFSASVSEIS
jgi:hypothetical protein